MPNPGKVKLIITADDYGVNPAVNQGIRKGIKAGVINTVTVLMNFPNSTKYLKELIDFLKKNRLLKKVGIGIHLNITTGKPASQKKYTTLIKKGRFLAFDQIKLKWKKLDEEEIKYELGLQIKRFIKIVDESGSKVPLDHFTSQHNVLHTYPKFAKIIAELCETYKDAGKYPKIPIPVRRPIPILKELKNTDKSKLKVKNLSFDTRKYIRDNQLKVESVFYLKWLKNDSLKNNISNIFQPVGVQCPHAMFFSFFGTTSGRVQKINRFKDSIQIFREAAVKQKILKPNDTFVIEVIHHIGTPPTEQQKNWAEKISGFDLKYFLEYRANELELVESPYYQDLLNLDWIELGHYSDLNAP